jgi:hypothetical protein
LLRLDDPEQSTTIAPFGLLHAREGRCGNAGVWLGYERVV